MDYPSALKRSKVPIGLHAGLVNYIEHHRQPGSFLLAALLRFAGSRSGDGITTPNSSIAHSITRSVRSANSCVFSLRVEPIRSNPLLMSSIPRNLALSASCISSWVIEELGVVIPSPEREPAKRKRVA